LTSRQATIPRSAARSPIMQYQIRIRNKTSLPDRGGPGPGVPARIPGGLGPLLRHRAGNGRDGSIDAATRCTAAYAVARARMESNPLLPNSLFQSKASVLAELVKVFTLDHPRPLCERPTGSRGAPADPRLTNPYFAQWAKDRVKAAEERLTDRREAAMKSGLPLALVAQ